MMNEMVRRKKQPLASSTKHARRAIAEFVEGNIPRFSGWLEQVAGGIPQYDGDGEIVKTEAGVTVWLVKPDPLAAIKAVADIAEYHLPKLSRAEVSSISVTANLGALTVEQLRAMRADLLEGRSVDSGAAEIDITPTEEVPAWITK